MGASGLVAMRRRLGTAVKVWRRGGMQSLLDLLTRSVRSRTSNIWRLAVEPISAHRCDAPLVSIVVVAHDRSPTLEAVLSAIQHQQMVDWECIVVDDASRDRSLDVAQRFAAVDTRFVVVHTSDRRGPSEGWAAGVDLASAGATLLLDDRLLISRGASDALLASLDGPDRPDRVAMPFVYARTVPSRLARACLMRRRPCEVTGTALGVMFRTERLRAATITHPLGVVTPTDEEANRLHAALARVGAIRVVSGLAHEGHSERIPGTDSWTADVANRGYVTVTPAPTVVTASPESMRGAVVLVAEAEYHVDELGPLLVELERAGQRAVFMRVRATGDSTVRALGRYAETVIDFDLDVSSAAAVVTMNDWGACRELVESARRDGVPTFAKVEGVQDFDDLDTGRSREPYRRVDYVLGQGDNDRLALPDSKVIVVGSSRLERIWHEQACSMTERAVVNYNFTFRVLTEHCEPWIDGVRAAAIEAGLPAIVSAHPASRSRVVGLPVTDRPFRYAATLGGVLVSRFSTVPFEAMARGMAFVYHNPHGERVPTFASPNGAFSVSLSVGELTRELSALKLTDAESNRARAEGFFRAQVDMQSAMSSEERAARTILDRLVR